MSRVRVTTLYSVAIGVVYCWGSPGNIACKPSASADIGSAPPVALEKRVRALKPLIGKQRTPANIIPGALPSPAAGHHPPRQKKIRARWLLKLTKLCASIKGGQYSSYYEISDTLHNNYDKSAKAINGSMKFPNPIGPRIL